MTRGEMMRKVKEMDSKITSLTFEKRRQIERCGPYLVGEGEKKTLLGIIKPVQSLLIAGREAEIAHQLPGIFQNDTMGSYKSLCVKVARIRWGSIFDADVQVILFNYEYVLGSFTPVPDDYNRNVNCIKK